MTGEEERGEFRFRFARQNYIPLKELKRNEKNRQRKNPKSIKRTNSRFALRQKRFQRFWMEEKKLNPLGKRFPKKPRYFFPHPEKKRG